MTPGSGPSWNRGQWALYWLFVAASFTAAVVLNIAFVSNNLPVVAAVVGLGLAAFVVGLILWAVRFLRRQ